jgi:hypothetical protein
VWKQVTSYSLAWRSDKNQGVVLVTCEDDTKGRNTVESPRDLEALGSILRSEKPIYYSATLQAIRTGEEPPGEEEAGW